MVRHENPEERDPRGRFAPGNAGGPGGTRRRRMELRHAAEDAINPEHLAAMIRRATRMGLEGDLAAMRFVFDRTTGKPSEAPAEPVNLLPLRLETTADCRLAIDKLIARVCDGTVNHDTAKLLVDAIQARLKAIELTELEERLAQLEQQAAAVDSSSHATPGDRRYL